MGVIKGYNYASILYPDSAPEGWKLRIDQTHLRCCVSPLHSPDPDPESEHEKKSHYHVVIMFDSQTSLKQAQEVFEFIGCINYVLPLRTLPGYLKYIIHRNRPDKEQFSPDQVICFNGADYGKLIDDEEVFLATLEDMTDYILEKDISSFKKFTAYAKYNNKEWFRILSCRSTLFLRTLINSILEEKKEEEKLKEKELSK